MPAPHIQRRAQAPPASTKQSATIRHPEGTQAAHAGVQAWTAAAAAAAATASVAPTPGLANSTNLPPNRDLVNKLEDGTVAGSNSETETGMPAK